MKQVIDAILFAATNHAGQFRKDGVTPYINHPIEVMHFLAFTADISDEEILMAAVLHDVVEDTSVTVEEIAQRFGQNVADIVLELTDDISLSKEERKHQQLMACDGLSYGAKVIRISDKICNVYDIIYAPPGDWDIHRRRAYLIWANSVIMKITGTNEGLEQHFEELMEEGFRCLEISV
ncbi:MAG: HD domain-containing protein [Bacteroidota bacterium]|nr:HD domain-containing protein [Bacteroidota bacterium]